MSHFADQIARRISATASSPCPSAADFEGRSAGSGESSAPSWPRGCDAGGSDRFSRLTSLSWSGACCPIKETSTHCSSARNRAPIPTPASAYAMIVEIISIRQSAQLKSPCEGVRSIKASSFAACTNPSAGRPQVSTTAARRKGTNPAGCSFTATEPELDKASGRGGLRGLYIDCDCCESKVRSANRPERLTERILSLSQWPSQSREATQTAWLNLLFPKSPIETIAARWAWGGRW